VVIEEEEATGGKGEEGWLLILAFVRLTSIIDRSIDGPATAKYLQDSPIFVDTLLPPGSEPG